MSLMIGFLIALLCIPLIVGSALYLILGIWDMFLEFCCLVFIGLDKVFAGSKE